LKCPDLPGPFFGRSYRNRPAGLRVDVISFGGGIAISPTWQKALCLLGQMPRLQLQSNAPQL